jgi:PAS domain S-box-containing protein
VKIRPKLVVLLLMIGLLPTIGVSIIAYVTIRNQIMNTTAEQLESTATVQEQRINNLMRERIEEVSKLANQLSLQVNLRDYLQTGSAVARTQLDQLLSDKRIDFPEIQQIYITDLEDRVVAATLSSLLNTHIDGEGGATIRLDPRDNVSKLYMTIPVSIDRQNVANLTFVYRADDVTAIVQDYTGLGDSGETVIISSNDPEALSLFPLRKEINGNLSQSLNGLEMSSHVNQTYEAIDYDGQRTVNTVRSLNSVGWLMGIKIDRNEAYASLSLLAGSLVSIVVVSSVAIVLIAFAMTRSITSPILKIVHTSRLIGGGDMKARTDVKRSDEIGILADSINNMGNNLSHQVDYIQGQSRRLEIILNTATESILAIDGQGRIVIANASAAHLAEKSISELANQPINQVFTWQRGGYVASVDYYTRATRTYQDLEYRKRSGDVRYLKLIVSPVADSSSESVKSIITIHDETEQRDLESMKVDFVSMAAHELRTPLAALRGYLELVAYRDEAGGPDAKHHITKALKSTAELSGLISNLLDVSRIERGALSLDFSKVDLAQLVQKAVEDSRFAAEDKKLVINYHGPQTGAYAYADDLAVREVINNLIANAIKYTNQGQVDVYLEQRGQMLMVGVKDSGIGIPQRALPNLFTKFYRVHGGLDSGSQGTGLGLFIAKSIVERHSGKISVQSQEGAGSVFSFTLPVYDNQDKDAKQTDIQKSGRNRAWFTKNINR